MRENLIKSYVKSLLGRVRGYLIGPIVEMLEAGHRPTDAGTQVLIQLMYRYMDQSGQPLPKLSEVGFKVFSQTDEDGLLLYIFSLIGTTNKKCVEVCAGDGTECNTANLIINHGWSGLMIDGNPSSVKTGERVFRKHKSTYVYPPKFVCAWITRDNVNCVLQENGFAGQIDLLVIDVDGIDYWLWKAISVINPRVVVVEYQSILGPNRSVTVPYSDDFRTWNYSVTDGWLPNFAGASLRAFAELAKEKGYHLVGCNRYGFNAFFLRDDAGTAKLPEVKVEDCFAHPRVVWGMQERYPKVKDMPWVEV